MLSLFDGLVLELVPHCASVPPEGWDGDHDVRPLSEAGRHQAEALAAALGTGVDGIYSSPALRCLQTVQPLARATGLSIVELVELLETRGFAEPPGWTPIEQAVGGAWSAGKGLRAVMAMAREHPGGRVVAASHGDVIPVLFATLCAATGVPLPAWPGRGGWYTVRFDGGSFAVTTHDADDIG